MMLPMKKSFLLCLMTISIVQAADTTTGGFVNGDVQVNDALTKMMAVEGVKPIYDDCKKDTSNNTGEKLSTCLWDKIKINSALKEKVLAASKEAAKSDPSGSAIKEKFSTDPAMQKLGEVISAKLKDALFGAEATRDKDNLKAVDQKSFNDIYRAELNKTMVDAFMSYCLDTVGTSGVTKKALDDARTENLKELNNSDPQKVKTFLTPNDGNPNKWNTCIAGITTDCKAPTPTEKSRRACLVTQYVDSARKNISAITETDKVFDNMKSGSKNLIQNDLKSLDSLVTVTSKDVETAYKDTTEAAKKEMDKCLQTKSEQDCKQFLNTATTANETGSIEFALQQHADAENFGLKVDKIKTPEEMKAFLEEQGYKKDKIDTMDLNAQSISDIQKEIKDRYANEKEALIKEMNDRISNKTAVKDGKIDANATGDKSKLVTIQTELQARTANMTNLFKFSNIVSGYLTVDVTQNGKKSDQTRNTASMASELNSNDANKTLKTALEAGGAKLDVPTDSGTQTSTLDVDSMMLSVPTKKTTP